MKYSFDCTVEKPFSETLEKVRSSLAVEEWGIVSEIDMATTLKAKLNEDIPGYLILGACQPQSALDALRADINIGAIMPCNVVVREVTKTSTGVIFMDPALISQVSESAALKETIAGVRESLVRVCASLSKPAS